MEDRSRQPGRAPWPSAGFGTQRQLSLVQGKLPRASAVTTVRQFTRLCDPGEDRADPFVVIGRLVGRCARRRANTAVLSCIRR